MNIDRLNLTLADIEAQLLRKLAESANLDEMDGEECGCGDAECEGDCSDGEDYEDEDEMDDEED